MPNGRSPLRHLAVFTVTLMFSLSASADVFNMPVGQTNLEMVPVGNAGNLNDPLTGYGTVPYNYNIGEFEITIGQYVQFLNAVAKADTYGLYNAAMGSNANVAGISRGGSSGAYSYNVLGSPNKPIAYTNWGDAARFANWITNGQPTGPQGAGTTETGSYTLNGAQSSVELLNAPRESNARFVVPSQNEWYKAAYYDPTKGGSNYWLYPMRTDAVPDSAPPPGTLAPNASRTGNIFGDDGIANGFNNGYAVTGSTTLSSSQNYLTEVGAYSSAQTYYGTFDQGGGLWEWNEEIIANQFRGLRGGGWAFAGGMQSTHRGVAYANYEYEYIGFRVALVPEPAALSLLTLGAGFLIQRPRAFRFQSDAALV